MVAVWIETLHSAEAGSRGGGGRSSRRRPYRRPVPTAQPVRGAAVTVGTTTSGVSPTSELAASVECARVAARRWDERTRQEERAARADPDTWVVTLFRRTVWWSRWSRRLLRGRYGFDFRHRRVIDQRRMPV